MINIENEETNRRLTEIRSGLFPEAWRPGIRHTGLSRADLFLLASAGKFTLTDLEDQLQVTWVEHYRDAPHLTKVLTFDACGRLVRHERTDHPRWAESLTYDKVGRVIHKRYYGGFEHNFWQARFEYPEGETDDHYTITNSEWRNRGEWEHLVQS